MQKVLIVVGLFNFYNITSNDILIENDHWVLTKKNLMLYFEYIKSKYNVQQKINPTKTKKCDLVNQINLMIHSSNIQIDINTHLKKNGSNIKQDVIIKSEKTIKPKT